MGTNRNARPHPANSPGDFYVEEGCCLSCGMPLHEAPDVFAWAEQEGLASCVVAKQPTTREGIDRTVAAMQSADVDCIRYRGNDTQIGRRLVEAGLADQCDQAPPTDAAPLLRNHATFLASDRAEVENIAGLAEDFCLHFKSRNEGRPSGFHVEAIVSSVSRTHARVKMTWARAIYHTVDFHETGDRSWLVITNPSIAEAGIGLSRIVDRWIQENGAFIEIRWYSAEQWREGGPYRATVI